eukprot:2885310-Prymnesium_polylepis.1
MHGHQHRPQMVEAEGVRQLCTQQRAVPPTCPPTSGVIWRIFRAVCFCFACEAKRTHRGGSVVAR